MLLLVLEFSGYREHKKAMILNILISGIFGVLYIVTAPLRALPDVSLPSGVTSALDSASGLLSSVDSFLPVDTMLTVLGSVLIIEALVVSYRIIVWVLTKIPGLSN